MRVPPEGAIRGENVPIENDTEQIEHARLIEAARLLGLRGEPFRSMREDQRIAYLEDRL